MTRYLKIVSLVLFVTSCGSGVDRGLGSGAATASAIDLNFIAVKGSINGGTLSLYLLNDSGSRIQTLVSGTTSGGTMSASLIPEDGPVEAEISGGTYVDESTGETKTLGTFNLRTRLSQLPRSGSTIILSALTEMAVQYSQSLSGSSLADIIDAANTKVAKASGLNDIVMASSPTDDPTKAPTDPTSQSAKYGILLAAICQQADTLDLDAKDLIDALAKDFKDGDFDGKNGDTDVTVTGGSTLASDAWTAGMNSAMDTYVNNANNPGFTTTSKPVIATSSEAATDTATTTVTSITSSTANGSYKAANTISIQIIFSSSVTVTGTPQLKLALGSTARSANYISGSGTNTLTFEYTIQAGDTSADLDYESSGALILNGGTIIDANNKAVFVALSLAGSSGSLGSNKSIVVDTTAPTPGNSGTMTATATGTTTATLSWTKASDNRTAQSGLKYRVYKSTSNNINTLANVLANGTAMSSLSTDVNSASLTGLSDSTTYYFNILLQDEAGNQAVYESSTASTTDGTAPTPGGSGTMTSSSVDRTSFTLNWTKATDNVSAQSALQYRVYKSTSNNITGVSNAETNGTAVGALTSDINLLAITGLTENTVYYFNVVVRDAAGNKAAYTALSVTPVNPGPTCNCPATYTADSSKLFCSKTNSTSAPGSFIQAVAGSTNGAYGPDGGFGFKFGVSSDYPYTENGGSILDSDGTTIATRDVQYPISANFWNSRLNTITIEPQGQQDTILYEIAVCLNIPVAREYVFGLAADNGVGFAIGGKTIFEDSIPSNQVDGATFSNWFLGGAEMAAGNIPVNFVLVDHGGAAAFGFELYQNTIDEVAAATAIGDLTVLYRSTDYIGQSVFAEEGTTCPSGAKYNACTSQCVSISTVACQ